MKRTTREPATSRANNPVGEYVGQYLERKLLAKRVVRATNRSREADTGLASVTPTMQTAPR